MTRLCTAVFILMGAAAAAAASAAPEWSPGAVDKKDLKKRLTKLQYKVTQKDATERPFKNDYWDNNRAGIYVDVVSGEPLFSSKDKFYSGTGWPSFTRPLEADYIVERNDKFLWIERTEIRSKNGDSHLGHVFKDGPEPTGLRYCINSASLRFIPAKDLKKEGYAKYEGRFPQSAAKKPPADRKSKIKR